MPAEEEHITARCRRARAARSAFSMSAATSIFLLDTTERVFRKVWEWPTPSSGARSGPGASRGQGCTPSHWRDRGQCAAASAMVAFASQLAVLELEHGARSSGREHPRRAPRHRCRRRHRSASAEPGAEAVAAPRCAPAHGSSLVAYWSLRQPRDAWTFELDMWAHRGLVTMGAVEFHFDFGSPNAGRTSAQIRERTGAKFEYVPIGSSYNNRSPAESRRHPRTGSNTRSWSGSASSGSHPSRGSPSTRSSRSTASDHARASAANSKVRCSTATSTRCSATCGPSRRRWTTPRWCARCSSNPV